MNKSIEIGDWIVDDLNSIVLSSVCFEVPVEVPL